MYVWIRDGQDAKPMPKMICPVPVKGVVAGSVAMKNPKKIELPMNNSNRASLAHLDLRKQWTLSVTIQLLK